MNIKSFKKAYKEFTGVSVNESIEDQGIGADEVATQEQYYLLGQLSVLEVIINEMAGQPERQYVLRKIREIKKIL